jgi:hypothetical protein
MAKTRRTGPTKKKMPLEHNLRLMAPEPWGRSLKMETYTTGANPWAPPHPMQMMEKVKVEMTKLVSSVSVLFND